jgi:hypothetical protein
MKDEILNLGRSRQRVIERGYERVSLGDEELFTLSAAEMLEVASQSHEAVEALLEELRPEIPNKVNDTLKAAMASARSAQQVTKAAGLLIGGAQDAFNEALAAPEGDDDGSS